MELCFSKEWHLLGSDRPSWTLMVLMDSHGSPSMVMMDAANPCDCIDSIIISPRALPYMAAVSGSRKGADPWNYDYQSNMESRATTGRHRPSAIYAETKTSQAKTPPTIHTEALSLLQRKSRPSPPWRQTCEWIPNSAKLALRFAPTETCITPCLIWGTACTCVRNKCLYIQTSPPL